MRDVLGQLGSHGFQFDVQNSFDQNVRCQVAQERAVFIEDFQRDLLLHAQPLFAEAVNKGAFVNPLQVTRAVTTMNGKRSFADNVADLEGPGFGLRAHRCGRKQRKNAKEYSCVQSSPFSFPFAICGSPHSFSSNSNIPGSCCFNSSRLKGEKSLREKYASVDSAKYSIGLVIA